MEMTSYEAGMPSWVDIGVRNIEATCTFYGSLFGWSFDDMGPDMGNYRLAKLRGKSVAGIGQAQRDDVVPFWSTYFTVDDIDVMTKAVTTAGGEQIGDSMQMEGISKIAVYLDSLGAQFTGWQSMGTAGAELIGEPGTLVWSELNTHNADGAVEFYHSVFGWETETTESASGMPPYTTCKLPGQSQGIAGIFQMDEQFPEDMGSFWMTYFCVENADESAAKAKSLGAQQKTDVREVPDVGRFAVFADPEGAKFSIFEVSPSMFSG